jgi:hypothetical protein
MHIDPAGQKQLSRTRYNLVIVMGQIRPNMGDVFAFNQYIRVDGPLTIDDPPARK